MRKPTRLRLKRPTNTKFKRPIRLKQSTITNLKQPTNSQQSVKSNQIRSKIQNKFNGFNYKRNSTFLNFEGHTVYIERNKENRTTLDLISLKAKKKSPQNSDLPIIFNTLKETAKLNGFNKIKGETWIFAEHPTIAKRYGVTIDPEQLSEFNKIKRKHNIIKIIGINEKKDHIISYNNNDTKYKAVDCIVKTENGPVRKTVKIPDKIIFLPFEINI